MWRGNALVVDGESSSVIASSSEGLTSIGRGDLQWAFAASGLTHISALDALRWSPLRFLGLWSDLLLDGAVALQAEAQVRDGISAQSRTCFN